MNHEGVYSRAFARALYGSATARGEVADVTQDVLALEQQWHGSPELRRFCRSHLPGSPLDHAKRVAALWDGTFAPTTIRFLGLLAQHDQLALIPLITRHYQRLDDQAQGRSDVRIRFACEPQADLIEQIRDRVATRYGPIMKVDVQVDPDLIAGFRLFINDQRIDASLAGRLTRLRYGLSKPMLPGGTTD